MALTLDGTTVLPSFGGGSGSGLAGGLGAGAIGGGLLGLAAGALLGGRGFGGWGGGYGAGAPATAVATDIVLNPAFQSLQNQIQSLSGTVQANELTEAVQSGIDHLDSKVFSGFTAAENAIANLSAALANGNFTTLQSINGLGRDITAAQTQALINNIQNFNQLQNSQQVNFNAAQAQTATATNQIIAQGTASQMAMATCCCEIKAAIAADGGLTRALINDLNVQNLRDQLATANGKVSNNEQNQYLLSTILTHLHPTTGTVIV